MAAKGNGWLGAMLVGASAGLTILSAGAAQTTIIQSNTGVGCSSVCINGQCTSTCDENTSDARKGNGDIVDKKFDLKDFTEVVSTNLETEIRQGETFSVHVSADSNLVDDVEVTKSGSTLQVGLKNGSYVEASIQVQIVMPDLKKLSQRGAEKLSFSGFDQSSLELDMAGAGGVRGEDNLVTSLMVRSSGAITLDLLDSELTNASVYAEGTSSIKLNFADNQGTISGHLDGVSALAYCGEPVNEVTVSGVADMQRIGCS